MHFKGMHIVVTGASSGIGLVSARMLAERGARVSLIARRKEMLDEAVASLGGNAAGFAADVGVKEELEAALNRARGMDFANAKTDVAGPGTVVTVTDIVSNQTETFTILGAWDSDPDHGIISYLTPVAMALVNHKVGDEVEIEMLGQKRRQRIEAIAAWKTEAAPAPEAAVEPAPTI